MVNDLIAAMGTYTAGPFAPVIFATEMLIRLPVPKKTLPVKALDWGVPKEVYVHSYQRLNTPGWEIRFGVNE